MDECCHREYHLCGSSFDDEPCQYGEKGIQQDRRPGRKEKYEQRAFGQDSEGKAWSGNNDAHFQGRHNTVASSGFW